jgi:hypothetical protein
MILISQSGGAKSVVLKSRHTFNTKVSSMEASANGRPWHVAPDVSIWAIEGKKRADWVGWWVICGDLPTDHISAAKIKYPRDAIRAIAEEWRRQATLMASVERHTDIRIGRPEDWASLAPLLETRASMLLRWANDGWLWEDVDGT